MDFAIIKTGGKQYKVAVGDKVKVEKLPGEEGGVISFEEVLLTSKGDSVVIGEPHVSGAKVEGKVLQQARDKKVLIFKYKSKTRSRKTRGHRQHFTEVEIVKV
jgi:large subunit ribosomal protein L21